MAKKEVVFKPITNVSNLPKIETEIKPIYDDLQAFRNKRYISRYGASSSGATIQIYQVPAGTTFILLSATYNAVGNNASGLGNGEVYTSLASTEVYYLLRTAGISVPAGTILQANTSMSWANGIPFPAGTTFTMWNGSNPSHTAVITGYEIPTAFKTSGL